MDLREARVGETGALLVGPPSGGRVGIAGVGREIEDVAVTARGEDDAVGRMAGDRTRVEIADNDALGLPVDEDEVEHLGIVVHLHRTRSDHLRQRRVSTEQELLAGLTASVKRAGNLSATEGPVVEKSAVFAGEGHTLGDTLVNDVGRDLGEAVDVGFAGAVITAFDGVVEQTVNAVAVVLVILRGVDTALSGDGVRAAGAIVEDKTVHLITELGHGSGSGSASQTGANDDHLIFPFVGRIDQLHVGFVGAPFVGEVAGGNIRIKSGHVERGQRCAMSSAAAAVPAAGSTIPVRIAPGIARLPKK